MQPDIKAGALWKLGQTSISVATGGGANGGSCLPTSPRLDLEISTNSMRKLAVK